MSSFTTARAALPRARFALLILGSLAGAMAADIATAANADSDVPSQVVKFNRQSLATEAGVADLYSRITSAARKVCPVSSIRDLTAQMQAAECRKQAVARAISQIDNSRLAELHAHSKNA